MSRFAKCWVIVDVSFSRDTYTKCIKLSQHVPASIPCHTRQVQLLFMRRPGDDVTRRINFQWSHEMLNHPYGICIRYVIQLVNKG
jgi:hypothetical protein